MRKQFLFTFFSILLSVIGMAQTPVNLPVTFDDPAVGYNLIDFGGNISSIVADPVVPTNMACKVIKPVGAELWAGTTIGGTVGFATFISFAPGATIITMRVYSPDAGIPVRMKVEDPNDPTKSVETQTLTTVANTWENLSFDFANQASGTAVINYNYVYKKMSLFFNFGTTGAAAGEKTYYCDDIYYNATGAQLTQVDLPVYFNNTSVNYALSDFGGNISSITLDPVAPTNKVCKVVKPNYAELWAGTTIGSPLGFATAIPFASGATKILMKVYSPDAGIPIRLKAEDPNNAGITVETEKVTTVANQWEILEFNFANQVAGTPALNFSNTYKKLSVFFNFGTTGAAAGEKTYYFDDIVFGETIIPTTINVTFQVQNPPQTPVYVFGSWSGWGNWPGTPMTSIGNGIYTVTLTFSPNTNFEYLYVNGNPPVKEILNPAWSCTNGNPTYTNRVLTLGIADTSICSKWDSCVSCSAPSLQQVDLPVTFDNANVNYALVDFGGNVSNIELDPVAATNKVCKVIKTAGAELWAGTTVGAPLGFANPVPFTPGNTKLSMRVYSPDAGIPIRMKVENASNSGISVETEKVTTVANSWETLEFNFANQVSGTPPINFIDVYNKLSVFFNFGTTGAVAGEKTYYFDDIQFVPAPPVFINVTFQVQTPDTTPVFAFGSWSGWGNWPGNAMTSIGNGFYAVTINFPAYSNHEFLFVNGDNPPVKEVLDPAWPCTNGNTQYTNRVLTLGGVDTTICLNWSSCLSCVVPVVPVNQALQNITIQSEEGACYDALDTITVAGNGTHFIVQEFGEATLIAGDAILMYPGTHAVNGSIFQAKIAVNDQYCAVQPASMVKSAESPEISPVIVNQIAAKIFPNPATSEITLDLQGVSDGVQPKFEMIGIRGETIRTGTLTGNGMHSFSVTGLPVGVYYIRIICGDQVITKMLMKR